MNDNSPEVIRQKIEKAERLALLYDKEIVPLWSSAFGALLFEHLVVPERVSVLDVACGTGYPTLQILPMLDARSRVIALDSSHELLRIAREKAPEQAGKKIFFKHGRIEDLGFASTTFDLVVCNCAFQEFSDPKQALLEMLRVTRPQGSIFFTLPLQQSFSEFFDIYREVLERLRLPEVYARLEEHIAKLHTEESLRQLCQDSGITDVSIHKKRFHLLFASGREFFFTPLVEYLYLQTWKDIVNRGDMLQKVFWHIKNAIDLYFCRQPFSVTIEAACVQIQK